MNIEKKLESGHSRAITTTIVNHVGSDFNRFKTLVQIFLNGDQLLSQRAAWVFSEVLLAHPELIRPYYHQIIKKLQKVEEHDAIARNILRVFQVIEIPEKYEAVLVDVCFQFIKSEHFAVGIRAFAITVAARICSKYPELARELLLVLIELKQQPNSPAMKVRMVRAIKVLNAVLAS